MKVIKEGYIIQYKDDFGHLAYKYPQYGGVYALEHIAQRVCTKEYWLGDSRKVIKARIEVEE